MLKLLIFKYQNIMVKLLRMKMMLLLCALVAGSSAWADTSTLTFTAACGGSGTADDGVKWTVTSDGTESNFDNTKGIHYGTSSAQVQYIQLSTSDISGTISKVVVNASAASGVSASVSVTVSGSAFGGAAQSVSSSANNYTFTGEASGAIVVKLEKPSKAAKAIYVKSITVTYSSAPSYTITAQSNNNSYGTVSLTGSIITAKPASGYTYASPAYTVSSGTATVAKEGNDFTVTPSSDCTVTINFQPIPSHTATFSVDGNTTGQDFKEGYAIIFPSDPADINGKKFMGWYTSAYSNASEAPVFVNTATAEMGNSDITYYAVFAEAEEFGEPLETKTQTLLYDTWTYGGTTTDKDTYRLFGSESYIESESFDLSKLSKVIVFAGTFGTLSDKTISVKSGSTVWGTSAAMATKSHTTENTITSDVSLTGNGKIQIVPNDGDGSGSGARISKVEIYTKEPQYQYTNYCTTVTTSVSVTITDAKFATFSNSCATDFSATGITVYKAKVESNAVKLTQVNDGIVPANTGVILYSETATTENVPFTTTEAVLSENELVATTTRTLVKKVADDKYNYILQAGPAFNMATTDGAYMPAGRAYLQTTVDASASSARLAIVFDGEATGIMNVNVNANLNKVYDLQGRRVMNATKGLYIVGGKKMYVK